MHVSKKLRKLDQVLQAFSGAKCIRLVVDSPDERILTKLGFSAPAQLGEHVLPAPEFGPSCRRNANGFDIVRRDLPKEIRTRQISWRWKEFHGKDVVEKEGIVDRPYSRYPREHVDAFSQELLLCVDLRGAIFIASNQLGLHSEHANLIAINTIRMFVEVFGTCEIVVDLDIERHSAERRQLNWAILPPGRRPWEESATQIGRALQRLSASSQIVVKDRFASLHQYRPDFTAYGQHGFSRYVVFAWEKAELFLLESTDVDNATYVLTKNWEEVSKLSKAEVLASTDPHSRLIHHKGWLTELRQIMVRHNIGR